MGREVRLGVTGHRVLPDEKVIVPIVRDFLLSQLPRLLDQNRGDWDGAPPPLPGRLTILSALAEGADRLVAREVLRFPGSSLEAVLPLRDEDYHRVFSTEESRGEFLELLARAGQIQYRECSRTAG